MIQTSFNPQSRVISTTYIGKIKAHDIIKYVNQLDINPDKEFLYLEDHTQAEFDFIALDIKQITHALYAKIRDVKSLKVAVVNLKPKETAYSLIAIRLLKAKNMQAKVFCTKEAAQDWLLMKRVVNNL